MSVKIEAVTVEHHESGFGIGHASPRISWRYASTTAKDWRQTGYEIEVTRGSAGGKPTSVKGSSSTLVPWPSEPLKSRERAKIRVRAQGSDGNWTEWSELSIEIETGLLDRGDWKAKMISGPPAKKELPKPPFHLVKRFTLDKVSNARVYATAHGIYELEINGKAVGDQVLAPGWTSYHHHLNYQTYDVTSLLKTGENVIGAHVGEGWYAGRLGKVYSNQFGDRLGFLGQLEVDGKVVVASDDSWQWAPSSWIEGGLYDGSTFDSSKEDKKWATTEATTKFSNGVEALGDPKAELCSSDSPPVRRKIELKAEEIITTPSGKKVLDFGQNLVGWLRLNENVKGDKLVIRHAEVLEDGEMGMRPLRSAKATDTITLGGDVKGWEPKFTFHGFRYAEVSGMDATLSLSSFTAIVVFSDMRPTGTFDSSHKGLNQLHANTIWGTRGNFVSVPTDCPQRDERMGWTGDIQVFSPTANYLYDTSGFLSAWMRDVSAETFDHNGVVPVTVPYTDDHGARPNAPQAAWADCIAMTPWDLYETTADLKILEDNFKAMKLWLDKGVPRGENGLWEPNLKRTLYADWLDPEAPPAFPSHGRTDTHFVANAYLVHVTGLVGQIAKVLGHKADAEIYGKQHKDLLAKFNDEYVAPSGRVAADTQTAFALALRFGLLNDKQKVHAADRLDYLIRWNWFKISTGFAGTPILLPVLAENGKLESAYRMLQEKDCPSWLYPVSMGATTIWERWDSMLPNGKINPGQMTSFNHYAYGSVCAFLHATVAGLSPLEPGWSKALIRPQPGGTVTHASTTYSSPIGTYAVKWELKGNKLSVEVEVPPNGSAKVVLPGVEEEIGSGKKSYQVDWKRSGEWPPKGIKGPQSQPHPDNFME